jgi:inorganic pyrophosphatase
MDGSGIDVWRGTDTSGKIDAIVCTVDLQKKDSEIKILIGCNAAEKALIMDFHNRSEWMKGILIER